MGAGQPGPTVGITGPRKAKAALQLWFGIVCMVNMQTSYLSSPFGYALFCLKSVVPPEIGTGIIFRSALPFRVLQALGLFFVIIFPDLILWLPCQVYGAGCITPWGQWQSPVRRPGHAVTIWSFGVRPGVA